MIMGVHDPQFVKLFGIALPEWDHEALVSDIGEGMIAWLENDAHYPDVVIDTGRSLTV